MKHDEAAQDLLLFNGKFETFDRQAENLRWVLIQNGLISKIGVGTPPSENQAELIDLKGAYVVPGMIDSHVHLVQSGINKFSTSLKDAQNIKEIMDLARSAEVIKTRAGDLIYLNGFEESNLIDGRLPTRWDLDLVSEDKMIWINSVEYQVSILNTKAYKYLKLRFNTDGIVRDDLDIPTGVLKNKASLMARKCFLGLIPDTYRDDGIKLVCEEALQNGITTVVAMEGGFLFSDEDAVYLHRKMPELPIGVELFFQTTSIEKVKELGLTRIGGNIMLDGSIQARTAALGFPYEDDYSTRGDLFFSDDELKKFVFSAIEEHLDISLHAVGARAISQALHVYYQARKTYPDMRSQLRVEHFELPSNEEIEMASELGVVLSMQPSCNYRWGGSGGTYEKRLGTKRMLRANPIGSIINHGNEVVCGSESDLTPLSPLVGIYAMANHPDPQERITPLKALELYTVNSARSLRLDHQIGEIEAGKSADLTVLSESLREVDPLRVLDVEVNYTIKDGRIEYRRPTC